MFGKKDEKLEMLKDLLGTRAAYVELVKNIDLNKDEKEIMLRASIEVNKEKPNQNILDQAHAILVQKSYAGTTSDEEQVVEEETPSNQPFNHKAYSSISSPGGTGWMKIVKPLIVVVALVLIYKMFTISSSTSLSGGQCLKANAPTVIRYEYKTKLGKNRVRNFEVTYDGKGIKISNIGTRVLTLDAGDLVFVDEKNRAVGTYESIYGVSFRSILNKYLEPGDNRYFPNLHKAAYLEGAEKLVYGSVFCVDL